MIGNGCERCGMKAEVYLTFKLGMSWTGKDCLVFKLCKESEPTAGSVWAKAAF